MYRILVIEDEEHIALGLKDDLELEEYKVDIIAHGDQVHADKIAGQYDLILLDLMLPGKDGYDICRELRLSGCTTPIIMLTAKTQEAEKVLGLDLGADDYIIKPFSPIELRARIRAVLRRGTMNHQKIFSFDNFEVEFDRFELRKDGEVVKLTPIEFKLLSTFIQNVGKVLTRDSILDLVWGPDVFVTDRAVDTHITNLRKKIESKLEEPRYIISIRGIGYRFDR